MFSLASLTLLLAGLIFIWHLFLLLVPQQAGTWLLRFPRSIWAGRILAAVAIGWVALLVWHADMAWLAHYRGPACLLAPVAYVLLILFVEELLAVRALGGIFLLLPALILDAAFLHNAASRLVMTCFAYLLVILGITWVWSPFMFRKMTTPWAGRPALCRVVGLMGIALALIMFVLGWFFY